jgi:hypothetical protein
MTWYTIHEKLPNNTRPVLVELVNTWRNYPPVVDAGSFDDRRGWWIYFCYKYLDGWRVNRWAEMPQAEGKE